MKPFHHSTLLLVYYYHLLLLLLDAVPILSARPTFEEEAIVANVIGGTASNPMEELRNDDRHEEDDDRFDPSNSYSRPDRQELLPLVHDNDNDDDDDDPPENCSENTPGYRSLVCWLWNLKVAIPDEKFRKGIFSVTIKDVTCSSFTIQSIDSSYIPSSSKTNTNNNTNTNNSTTAIRLSVDGISATCKGEYKSGLTSGHVTIKLDSVQDSDTKPFQIVTTVTSSSFNTNTTKPTTTTSTSTTNEHEPKNDVHDALISIPSEANVTSCSTRLIVPSDRGIIFAGSISAKLLELFASSIADHVTDAIGSIACPEVRDTLDPLVTGALRSFDEIIRDLIHSSSSDDNDNDDDDGNNNTTVNNNVSNDANHKEKKDLSHDPAPRPTQSSTIDDVPSDSSIVRWDTDLKLPHQILSSANNFLSHHMNKGIILTTLRHMGWHEHLRPDFNNCTADEGDCGYFFKGLNGLTKFLTNGTGELHFRPRKNVRFLLPSIGTVTLDVPSLILGGSDALTNLTLLSPFKDNAFRSSLGSEEGFEVRAVVNLVVEPVEGGIVQGGSLNETFSARADASDVFLAGSFDLTYLRETFEELSLGNVVGTFGGGGGGGDGPSRRANLECLLSGIVSITFDELFAELKLNSIDIDPIEKAFPEGEEEDRNLEYDIDQLINNVLRLVLNEYDEMVTWTIVATVREKIMPILNAYLKEQVANRVPSPNNATCALTDRSIAPTATGEKDHFYRFDESRLCKKVDELVDGSIPQINDFISCVSSYVQNRSIFDSYGNSKIRIRDFVVDNAGRFNSIDLLEPKGRYKVGGSAKSGECRPNATTAATLPRTCEKLRTLLTVELQDPLTELDVKLDLTVAQGESSSEANAEILYDVEEMALLQLEKVFRSPRFLVDPLYGLAFYGFSSSVRSVDVVVRTEYAYGGRHGDFFYSSESAREIGDVASSGLTTSFSLIEDGLNSLSRIVFGPILERKNESQGSIVPEEDVNEWMVVMTILFVVANIIILFMCKRYERDISGMDKRKRILPSTFPSSLLFHPNITNVQRVTIPLTIACTILAFIVSNMSTGASVDIEFKPLNGTQSFTLPDVFTFSLGETVSQMYQARVYTLMTLVLVFSGIWPYVKLLLMMMSFTTSQRFLSLQKRENMLIWLDALGKYSLVDSFVLVLMLVSFRFHFDIPGVGAIDSLVTPKFGFYSFMYSTIMSLIIGHGVTFLHRYSSMSARVVSTDTRESVLSHKYKMKTGNQVKLSWIFNIIWSTLTLTVIYLLLTGIRTKCFIFEFRGLAGLLLGDERVTRHSIASLGSSIPYSVNDPTAFGIQCIRWTYYFFALIMPFTCTGVIMLLFYVPLSLRTQHRIHTLAEICNAWSAIEVFLIATLASMLELSQFAAFMVGHNCDFMQKGIFKKAFDGLLEGDDTCFDVKSSLGDGSVFLFLGVSLHCAIIFFSLRLSHYMLEDRMALEDIFHPAENEPAKNPLEFIYTFRLERLLLKEYERNREPEQSEMNSMSQPLLDSIQ